MINQNPTFLSFPYYYYFIIIITLSSLFIIEAQSNLNLAQDMKQIEANPDAKRLYDDLLNNYNRLIRPVINNTETLTVWLGLKLAQLTEVNLRNQVITSSIWVVQKWFDYKLRWDPEEYGGLTSIYVPSELIWLPDIVLFNNADGNFEVTLMTRANLKYTGEVLWIPPAIYKYYCEMNVLYFPFDEQICLLKFGSWTYNSHQVDLKHIDEKPGSDLVAIGIDLTEFLLSVEWDLLQVPAQRNEEIYPCCMEASCCVEPYADITFYIVMRRKTLFYTVNLIIPLVGITFLTVLVFYLPSDSGEKVSLCSSILVSLTVFFLLLAEIIPPTSLAVPLLGKYLLFTMTLVTLSICVTVCVLNVHFRSPSTHNMSPWVRTVFLRVMPKMLLMRRPPYSPADLYGHNCLMGYIPYFSHHQVGESISDTYGGSESAISPRSMSKGQCNRTYDPGSSGLSDNDNIIPRNMSADMLNALQGVQFIAKQIKKADKDSEVIEDWKYVSMVLDRLFLWVFTVVCVVGTAIIILQAPSLYDRRHPIDQIVANNLSFIGNYTYPPYYVFDMHNHVEASIQVSTVKA